VTIGVALVSLACANPKERSWKNGWIYVKGSPYIIDEHGVSKSGWRLRAPWFDHDRMFADPPVMVSIDVEGVFISATKFGVWFIGQKGASQQPPAPDKLKATVLASSKGDGLLMLVDLPGKNDVQVLTCDED
jgi:hypothetical protein